MEETFEEHKVTQKEFDLVIFGASGFTGQLIVEEVARTAKLEPINWAISGRNEKKLENVLMTATKDTSIDLTNIPIILADANDKNSIKAMTAKTKVLLNCCGPYLTLGETVVKACIETLTHHLDMAAETKYWENIELKYHKLAKERGVYIIIGCGWASVPIDLGVRLLKNNFGGHLESVETFWKYKYSRRSGIHFNVGSWHSIIDGFEINKEIRSVFRQIFSISCSKHSKNKLKRKILPFSSKYSKGWSILFPGIDDKIVLKTEQFKHFEKNEYPVQIQTYVTMANFLHLIIVSIIMCPIVILASFDKTRQFLISHPKLFSLGAFTDDLNPEVTNDLKLSCIIVGKGWNPNVKRGDLKKADKTRVVKINGDLSLYEINNICLVQSGFTLIKESDKITTSGGVVTPAVVFENTGIYERFRRSKLQFNII